jgi:hypothetical protein
LIIAVDADPWREIPNPWRGITRRCMSLGYSLRALLGEMGAEMNIKSIGLISSLIFAFLIASS